MPTIHENQYLTPIVEFQDAPEEQQALIDGIAAEDERRFKHYVGYVSANVHASDEGRRVITYAQWQSKKDWKASGRTPHTEEASQ